MSVLSVTNPGVNHWHTCYVTPSPDHSARVYPRGDVQRRSEAAGRRSEPASSGPIIRTVRGSRSNQRVDGGRFPRADWWNYVRWLAQERGGCATAINRGGENRGNVISLFDWLSLWLAATDLNTPRVGQKQTVQKEKWWWKQKRQASGQ